MSDLDTVRSILRPAGPGVSLDDLERRGVKRADAVTILRELVRAGEATRVGGYWWRV